MPQGMVVKSLPDNDLSILAKIPSVFEGPRPRIWPRPFHLATNGNAGQVPSPYNPKYLLLKMPYRFNTSYQLLVRSSEYVLSDWYLSLDLQRSWP